MSGKLELRSVRSSSYHYLYSGQSVPLAHNAAFGTTIEVPSMALELLNEKTEASFPEVYRRNVDAVTSYSVVCLHTWHLVM